MLSKQPDKIGEPNDVMVGKCTACGTEVMCMRRECVVLLDGFAGMALCAECPGVTKRTGPDRHPRRCSNRVYMCRRL